MDMYTFSKHLRERDTLTRTDRQTDRQTETETDRITVSAFSIRGVPATRACECDVITALQAATVNYNCDQTNCGECGV